MWKSVKKVKANCVLLALEHFFESTNKTDEKSLLLSDGQKEEESYITKLRIFPGT